MKRWSTSLVISETEIKTSQYFSSTKIATPPPQKRKLTSVGEDVEKLEPFIQCQWECIIGHCVKHQVVPQNFKSLIDATVLLLHIYSRELQTYVDTKSCTGMFIALLIIAPNENNPSVHQLMKMQYRQTMKYYSVIRMKY